MPLDALKLGEEIVTRGEVFEITTRDCMCPLILGCYGDEESEQNMKVIKEGLKEAGYKNTFLLSDVPVPTPMNYSEKFHHFISAIQQSRRNLFPIYYIHPSINKGHGKGLISEFLTVENFA